ncbi:MAG: S8 family serine peptidase, partial [Gaiellaceae bacterium]
MRGTVRARSSWARLFVSRRGASVVLVGLALSLVAGGVSWGAPAPYDAVADVGSMYNTTSYTGAQAWWNAGYTGAGVDVAVIDTGVAPVPGLDAPGKVINGPDLSFESQAPNLTRLDTNGHGTHVAGIIAGRGSGAVAGAYAGD